jgi:phospholipid transport system transporter-binding protein
MPMARSSTASAFEFGAAGADGEFKLTGVLGFDTAATILKRSDEAFAGRSGQSVDLSGVTHADSAGLSVLLTWVERARRDGRVLKFTGLPEQLRGIARLCAVEPLLAAAEAKVSTT